MTAYSVIIVITMIIIIIVNSKNLGFECCSSDGLNITTEFYTQFYKLNLNITAVLNITTFCSSGVSPERQEIFCISQSAVL